MEFLKIIGSIAGSVFSRIVADELKAWAPTAVRWLTSMAVKKLPENQRERFAEEWQSDLGELPGDFAKLWYAFDLIRAAYKISAEFGPTHRSTSEKISKRLIDLLVCAFSTAAVMPLVVIIAIAVKLDSEGPVFIYHERIGQGGRPFRIRKFRTMYVDNRERLMAHLSRNPYQRELLERSHILVEDPRLTRVGRLLLATSLNELPQLWNVVKGEMTFVGPAALKYTPTEQLDEHFAHSSEKPGIAKDWRSPWLEVKIMIVRWFDRVFVRR